MDSIEYIGSPQVKESLGLRCGSRNGSACPNSKIYHESPPTYSDSQAQSAIQTPHCESDRTYSTTNFGIRLDVSGNYTSRITSH